MPFFNSLTQLPDDPILSLNTDFAADPRSTKVNLGVGAYKDSEGKPMVLNSVRKAEALLLNKQLHKEYLPIDGDPSYVSEGLKLLFGENSPVLASGRGYGAQTLGGTGALRIGAEFLFQNITKTIYLSNPTWPNHKAIFAWPQLKVETYPYYDKETHGLDFHGMCEAIKQMAPRSCILLHGCCHNPTGLDPTPEQWKILSSLIQERNILPFFDIAYQGFDQGVEQDAAAIRLFAEEGHEMLVASSYSKNFGLYGERVGQLSIVTRHSHNIPQVYSQVRSTIRANYSNPPAAGARIVATILKSPSMREEWQVELQNMQERIKEMRKALISGLQAKGSKRDFSFMKHQTGLFSFCSLDADQVQTLKRQYGIFMPNNGRISVPGLNWRNLDYVVDAIVSLF